MDFVMWTIIKMNSKYEKPRNLPVEEKQISKKIIKETHEMRWTRPTKTTTAATTMAMSNEEKQKNCIQQQQQHEASNNNKNTVDAKLNVFVDLQLL